ncbi:hypothetical protein OU5_0990 [Pseudomonas mandelii JR-1]|uniref:Uncharacterized protein n=1 Tax=Pseudomonas mandelii JR-1 TaxID=1147786 RepID=A0A024E548_9PSED|nr:hypothetical protein OU5_0990 [Pseudomonas mandelii JR-1]
MHCKRQGAQGRRHARRHGGLCTQGDGGGHANTHLILLLLRIRIIRNGN